MINEFNKSIHNGENIAKKNSHIKWTKTLKKQIIINYKEHLRYE